MTKLVFGVSNKVILKTVFTATETSQKIKISPVVSLDMILFQKANNEGVDQSVWQVFSHRCPFTLLAHSANASGLEVIKHEYSLKLKMKRNGWLLALVGAHLHYLHILLIHQASRL